VDEVKVKQASGVSKEARDERPVVFVISPIGEPGSTVYAKAKTVLTFIIKKAFPAQSWNVLRADDEAAPDSITSRVIERIRTSDYIVADLSGHNPNVFYELAVAHGYEKRIVQIREAGQGLLPFDVYDQRVIDYDVTDPESVDAAIQKISEAQISLEQMTEPPVTPLSKSGAFSAISSSDPGEGSNAAIASALEDIASRLRRLEARANTEQVVAGPGSPFKKYRESPSRRVVLEQNIERLLAEISQHSDALDKLPQSDVEEVLQERGKHMAKIRDAYDQMEGLLREFALGDQYVVGT